MGWSVACVIFELVTGDLLFDPKADSKRNGYSCEENHLALIIELIGPLPKSLQRSGKFVKELFHKNGHLRHISHPDLWPIREVLLKKYRLPKKEALALADFLSPMLQFIPEERASAKDMLHHP